MKLKQGTKLKLSDGDVYMYCQVGCAEYKMIGIRTMWTIGNRFGETVWGDETTLEDINDYYEYVFTITDEVVTI